MLPIHIIRFAADFLSLPDVAHSLATVNKDLAKYVRRRSAFPHTPGDVVEETGRRVNRLENPKFWVVKKVTENRACLTSLSTHRRMFMVPQPPKKRLRVVGMPLLMLREQDNGTARTGDLHDWHPFSRRAKCSW